MSVTEEIILAVVFGGLSLILLVVAAASKQWVILAGLLLTVPTCTRSVINLMWVNEIRGTPEGRELFGSSPRVKGGSPHGFMDLSKLRPETSDGQLPPADQRTQSESEAYWRDYWRSKGRDV